MKVAELRDLLATLPDDDLVYVGVHHVRVVVRDHQRAVPLVERVRHDCPTCGDSHPSLVVVGSTTIPAGVALYGQAVGTWQGKPAPQVEYRGRWTKAARAAIDTHTEEPDR